MTYTVEILRGGALVVLEDGITFEHIARHKAVDSIKENMTTFARVISNDSGGEIWSAALQDNGDITETGLTGNP